MTGTCTAFAASPAPAPAPGANRQTAQRADVHMQCLDVTPAGCSAADHRDPEHRCSTDSTLRPIARHDGSRMFGFSASASAMSRAWPGSPRSIERSRPAGRSPPAHLKLLRIGGGRIQRTDGLPQVDVWIRVEPRCHQGSERRNGKDSRSGKDAGPADVNRLHPAAVGPG